MQTKHKNKIKHSHIPTVNRVWNTRHKLKQSWRPKGKRIRSFEPKKSRRSQGERNIRMPRMTGNVGVNADMKGPNTRSGWFLAIIVIVILIFVIPWALVNSLGFSLQTGFGGIAEWLSGVWTGLSTSVSGWWNTYIEGPSNAFRAWLDSLWSW